MRSLKESFTEDKVSHGDLDKQPWWPVVSPAYYALEQPVTRRTWRRATFPVLLELKLSALRLAVREGQLP